MKGISEEIITPQSAKGHSFDSEIIYSYGKVKTKFNGICLKQDSVSFIHGNVVNLYLLRIKYIVKRFFTPGNCLFGAAMLTKNDDPDKYGYSGYGIRFDASSEFPWVDVTWG